MSKTRWVVWMNAVLPQDFWARPELTALETWCARRRHEQRRIGRLAMAGLAVGGLMTLMTHPDGVFGVMTGASIGLACAMLAGLCWVAWSRRDRSA